MGLSHYLRCVCANDCEFLVFVFCLLLLLRTPKRDIIFNLMKVVSILEEDRHGGLVVKASAS